MTIHATASKYASTKRYRETPKGVLTNIYNKMKNRRPVSFSLIEFHNKFLNDKTFLRLHDEWIKSGKKKEKKPSVDRINCKLDYTMENIHIISWGDNRYKQKMERRSRKGSVIQYKNGVLIAEYRSQREAVLKTGISQGNMSENLNGKRPHCEGFVFVYKSKVIGNVHQHPHLLDGEIDSE